MRDCAISAGLLLPPKGELERGSRLKLLELPEREARLLKEELPLRESRLLEELPKRESRLEPKDELEPEPNGVPELDE